MVDRAAGIVGVPLRKPPFKRFAIGKARRGRQALFLAKPLTYMNASGDMLTSLFAYTGTSVQDLLVVCDSLDLPAGVCRLRGGGSSAGQKGLESVLRRVGSTQVARIVIGIGRPASREAVVSYVLEPPRGPDAAALESAIEKAAHSVLRLLEDPIERVMNDLNRSPESGSAGD